MLHARDDYSPIQDPRGLIPADEPVFLIRGQDRLGPEVLDYYATIAREEGVDPALIEKVEAQAERMRWWQRGHRAKTPDLPEVK
jgi:hypothetical protein